MVEYINQFINKKIFNIAKKIRFMLFFTEANIFENRGKIVREQIEIFLRIFSGNLSRIDNSIIIVVTKVNPNDDEFYLENVTI